MALGAAVTLFGCGRPVGVMQSIAVTNKQTTKVDLLVATTRKPDANPAILFSGERGSGLKTDAVTISIPPNREIGQVQWPSRIPGDPSRNFITASVQPLTSLADNRAWLKTHMPKSKHVLVFVHGFNNRYEEAVYRFAQIVHDSHADVAPVVFTWPSRASVFSYAYDRESTNFSRDALEELLRRVANSPSVDEVTVMAHSMGAWLAVESLRQMAIRNGRVVPKIDNVILASPDLDIDVFASQFAALGRDKPHFTLFVSQNDRALRVSRRIAGSIDRLGQIDPTSPVNSKALENLGITVIDLTKLRTGDPLNHGKFASSPEVVKLIGTRLLAGQQITESDFGLGDAIGAVALGAAETVGSAASVAVSTPIAVFDRRTRENYGMQVQRLGQSVNNTVGSVGDSFEAGLPPAGSPIPQPSAAASPRAYDADQKNR
jgi:esterase/lipase superfamily enzyme